MKTMRTGAIGVMLAVWQAMAGSPPGTRPSCRCSLAGGFASEIAMGIPWIPTDSQPAAGWYFHIPADGAPAHSLPRVKQSTRRFQTSPRKGPPLLTDSSARRLWDAVLGRLQLQTPKATFDTWLAGTSGEHLADDALTVSAPTAFAVAWLEGRMQGLADTSASSIAARSINVRFVLQGSAVGASIRRRSQKLPPQAARSTQRSPCPKPSTRSSDCQRTVWHTQRRWRWPVRRGRPTTHYSSTAGAASGRLTCCTR